MGVSPREGFIAQVVMKISTADWIDLCFDGKLLQSTVALVLTENETTNVQFFQIMFT